jgi:acyl-CoA synthetase (AMP-forming)/AMP-acid ligase II
MRGYYKDPVKTKEHFRDFDGVSHIVTGDYAILMGDGTVVLLGRGSSVVNTGGEKVFPEEVEDTIKRMPRVLDCVVVGVPDERLGEHVAAVVESLEADKDPASVAAWAKRFLAAYKAPKEVVFSKVPRMPNGKPDIETARSLVIKGRGAQAPADRS